MKKFSAISLILSLIICLSSCVNVKEKLELSHGCENAEAVELFFTDEVYDENNVHVFREKNTPIKTLKTDLPELYAALCELKFEREVILFPIPMDGGCDLSGYIISVVYSGGDYDLISYSGLYSFVTRKDGRGRHKYDYSDYCGKTPWNDFIEQHFDISTQTLEAKSAS